MLRKLYRALYSHKGKILAQRIIFKIIRHIHSSHIGMSVKNDTVHIEYFALMPVRTAPNADNRWNMRIAFIAPNLHEYPLFCLRITNIIDNLESHLPLVSVSA